MDWPDEIKPRKINGSLYLVIPKKLTKMLRLDRDKSFHLKSSGKEQIRLVYCCT